MNNFVTNQGSRKRLFISLLILAVIALARPSDANSAEYQRIVAFGDSLMDSGNAFVLTGEIATQPFAPVPGAAYAIGGHHFSNGKTWVEQLGQAIGLQESTGPSARDPVIFSNYAIGGSRARDGAAGPSATQQVTQYLAFTGGTAPADDLFIFGFGGNDVRDALLAQNPTIVADAVNAIAGNLLSLCTSGARHIVVANVANIGITPVVQAIGEPAITGAAFLSAGLNNGVQQAINDVVQVFCPDTRFSVLDLFGLSNAIFSFPQGFGFVSAEPCLSFGVTGNAICSEPDTKFFWDGIHPTRAGHALIAEQALQLLENP
jgi:phospholipase/lecithinase/hemolysin